MSAWESRVDQLLYEGEEVRVQVGGENVQIVVTSHRVMAFLPEEAGPDFRAVDLPNVTGVSRKTTGTSRWFERGVKASIVGVVLLVGGLLADFEGVLIGGDVASSIGQVGLGGILGLFATLRTVFALIDDLLLLGGLVGLLVGLGAIGYYYSTRRESVVIAVTGREDIVFPAEALSGPALSKVADAVDPPKS